MGLGGQGEGITEVDRSRGRADLWADQLGQDNRTNPANVGQIQTLPTAQLAFPRPLGLESAILLVQI